MITKETLTKLNNFFESTLRTKCPYTPEYITICFYTQDVADNGELIKKLMYDDFDIAFKAYTTFIKDGYNVTIDYTDY